jgi:hypothetical protein
MANRIQTHKGPVPSVPSSFADGILQFFGGDFDPDPLFLEESWTFGLSAAAENLRRRRQNPAERERQSRAFRELDNLGSVFVAEDHHRAAESLLADRADMIRSRYASTWSQRPERTATTPPSDIPQSWSPKEWTPEHKIAHRHIPQGWMPESVAGQNPGLQEVESFAEPWDNMTVGHAHLLFGTIATSTREQVRSAYRRKVSAWHPDRMQCAPQKIREYATQQMAAINEAYRLLRTALLEDAA